MAVSGIEHPSNQHIQGDYQHQVNQSGSNHQRARRADRDSDQDSGGSSESQFTPSSAQSNESAGTYQVSQVQFFSAAALFLLAQTGSSSPSQPPAANPSTAAPTQVAPATLPAAPSDVPQAGSQPVTPATGTTASATTPGASTPSTQDTLQALNSVLQSLGLNDQQIKAFDQVASFINSLSPAVFADLVSQIQTLAQQVSQGSQSASGAPGNSAVVPSSSTDSAAASPAGAAPSTGTADAIPVALTATPATSGTTSSAAQPTGPYQIEELSIRFTGVEVQGSTGSTNGSSNGAGGTFDLSAFNLSIQEVSVTLANGNGQSAQITAPQPPASNTSTAQNSATAAATAS